jgi:cytochrome d ubiquinol oxidase subunit I
VWITFIAVFLIYIGLGVTLILVLRIMSRRWREGEAELEGGPYGPRPAPARQGSVGPVRDEPEQRVP